MGLTQVSKDGVKNDAIDASKLPANSVGASELADNAVDTNAIESSAVTNGKLADNAITSAKIANSAVTNSKLGDDSVTGSRIADNAVATEHITNGSVTAAKLASGVQTTINNNADNRVITGSDTANTLNAESNLNWDGSHLAVGGSFNPSPHSIGIRSSDGSALSIGNTSETSGGSHDAQIVATGGSHFNNLKLTGHHIKFFANGSDGLLERARVTANGITFNGDTAAANALDDYEEGTFTLQPNNNLTFNTSYNVGEYTKIGNVVTLTFLMYINTVSGTNIVSIDLPFTNKSGSNSSRCDAVGTVMHDGVNTGNNGVKAYIGNGNNQMNFYKVQDTGSWSSLKNSDLTSANQMYVTISYRTA